MIKIEISDLTIRRLKWWIVIVAILAFIYSLFFPPLSLLCTYVGPCGDPGSTPNDRRSVALWHVMHLSLGTLPLESDAKKTYSKQDVAFYERYKTLNISQEELAHGQSKCPDMGRNVKVCAHTDKACLAVVRDGVSLGNTPGPDGEWQYFITSGVLKDNPYRKTLGQCIISSITANIPQEKNVIPLHLDGVLFEHYPSIMEHIIKVASQPCHYLPSKGELIQEYNRAKSAKALSARQETLESLESPYNCTHKITMR